MREILFRGKRVDNGEWVEGFYVLDPQANEGEESQIYYTNEHPCGCALIPFSVVLETVGQYTGLTDKNGKKIFAGDILKYTRKNWHEPLSSKNRTDLIGFLEIYYDDTCAAFKCRHYDENKKLLGSGFLLLEDSRAEETILEVIGNVDDNPELLEERIKNEILNKI